MKVKDVQHGKTTRKSFARINEILEMPNLIEVQKKSYQWFLDEGLREVFADTASITDYTGNLELSFLDYSMDEDVYKRQAVTSKRDLSLSDYAPRRGAVTT